MNRFREGFTSTGAAAGLVALLLTTTGTAVAAPLVIGSQQIKNHSITAVDIKPGSLNGTLIGNGTITGLDIKDGSLSRADIAGSTITGKQVKNKSITAADIDTSGLSVPKAKDADHATKADDAGTVNGVSTSVVEKTVTGCVGPRDPQTVYSAPAGWSISLLCVPGSGKEAPYEWELYFMLGNSGAFVDTTTTLNAIGGDPLVYHYLSTQAAKTGFLAKSSFYQGNSSGTFVTTGGHLTKVDVTSQSPGATPATGNYSTMNYQMVITERD